MFTRDPNSHPRPLPAPAPATSTRESRPATFRHTRLTVAKNAIVKAAFELESSHVCEKRSNAPVFTLRSKLKLNWTRAIRPVIAQSVQFSKTAVKLNIDLCSFCSHRKEALSLLL